MESTGTDRQASIETIRKRAEKWAKEDEELRSHGLFGSTGVEAPAIHGDLPAEIDARVELLRCELDGLPPAEVQSRIMESLAQTDGYRDGPDPYHLSSGDFLNRADVARVIAAHHVRALLMGRISTLTEEEWAAIYESFGRACAYCETPEARTIDHMVPLSRGGTNCAANVVPACKACNSRKHAKPMGRFLREAEVDEAAVYRRMAAARTRRKT